MLILLAFASNLTMGLAAAMLVPRAADVTSGFFRVHLYVALGLMSLATLAAWRGAESISLLPPLFAAVASYVGSACWLYERHSAGRILIAVVGLLAWWSGASAVATHLGGNWMLATIDSGSCGLALGFTFTSMLLGHWYLNQPGMKLAPLKRLVVAMGASIVLRGIVVAIGAVVAREHLVAGVGVPMLSLRWLSGVVGALLVVMATWQVLKIPNTQSATGLLYVGVICVFLGETASLLLSSQAGAPL